MVKEVGEHTTPAWHSLFTAPARDTPEALAHACTAPLRSCCCCPSGAQGGWQQLVRCATPVANTPPLFYAASCLQSGLRTHQNRACVWLVPSCCSHRAHAARPHQRSHQELVVPAASGKGAQVRERLRQPPPRHDSPVPWSLLSLPNPLSGVWLLCLRGLWQAAGSGGCHWCCPAAGGSCRGAQAAAAWWRCWQWWRRGL